MVAAQHKPRRCLLPFSFFPPSRLTLPDGVLGLQSTSRTPRPTGTGVRVARYFYLTRSAMALQFIMSNQQSTGFSWSSPAGNTSNFGAPSSTPGGGHANAAPGATYNLAGAGAAATAVFTLAPVPRGGSMTLIHIAQPGHPYASTRAAAPIMAAHFANAPVALVPAPPGGLPTLNTHTAPPRAAYAPSPGVSVNTIHPANAPYLFGNPHVAPRYTYQYQPPQLPLIPTSGRSPPSTQDVPQPPRAVLPYPTHATAPPTPPSAPPPALLSTQS